MTETGDARWEYRLWDPPSSAVTGLADRGTAHGVDERRDVYLVGADRSVNAKLRGGTTLDVKRLLDTDGDTDRGLQRWRPDAPAELPLTAAQLDHLLADLGLGVPTSRWTDAELADPTDTIAEHDGRVVTAVKRRLRYRVDGVSAELVRVRFDGEPRSCIAIEDDEPGAVRAVREQLALDGPNVAMHVAAARSVR